ncbi:hypothetical protein Agabi119p4_1666 [Agaricus bisporus var. burnettii]|uniref:BAG domain-containing protein n=1 Tax=Agaricus bisporus var. burnettii TaxID=192524 RepID=A0A8H7F7R7_AGABI|nr:hypothetical protein Agabi119p4_1666 [Agaricus bisporus var. burnettii]
MLLKWQKQRFTVPFPGPAAPLAALRHHAAELSHLPPAAFKLIHAGAVMKDDAAPLSAYKLTENSTVFLIGDDPTTPASASEHHSVSRIQAELSSVRSQLTPHVHAFLAALRPPSDMPPTPQDHTRLGELLLQSLLRLDAIAPERDWPTARAERKAAVREVQELLDNLDSAWAAYSNP